MREASLECLRCGQWNMGLANQDHGKSNKKMATEIMPDATLKLQQMCQHVHFVVLNELHVNLHDQFERNLGRDQNLRFRGWPCGDAVVWRRST